MPTKRSKTLLALMALVLLGTGAGAPKAPAQDAATTFDVLRREPATLFDIGIISLRQRLDREAARYMTRANVNSARAVVFSDVVERRIDLDVTIAGAVECEAALGYFLREFLNLESGVGRAEAAAFVMQNAFGHRGIEERPDRMNVGRVLASRTVLTVRTPSDSCSTPLAG